MTVINEFTVFIASVAEHWSKLFRATKSISWRSWKLKELASLKTAAEAKFFFKKWQCWQKYSFYRLIFSKIKNQAKNRPITCDFTKIAWFDGLCCPILSRNQKGVFHLAFEVRISQSLYYIVVENSQLIFIFQGPSL